MHKFIILAAAGLLATAGGAFATDTPTADTSSGLESSPANQRALQTSQTIFTETQDGNELTIAPDGTVSVYKFESKMIVPDGTITLKDGNTLTVKDGKKVQG